MAPSLYFYSNTGYTLTHAPENLHLIVESTTALYYVSTDDLTQIWKYTISTGSDALLQDEDYDIEVFYHDRDNNRLYYIMSYMSLGALRAILKYVDLTDDSINSVGEQSVAAGDSSKMIDMAIESDGTIWLFGICTQDTGPNWIWGIGKAIIGVGGGLDTVETGLGADPIDDIDASFFTNISNTCYFLVHTTTDHIKLYEIDISAAPMGSINELEDCGANLNLPDSKALQGIATSVDNDTLYFILKNTTDSKNYLYTYEISTDTLTSVGAEYNVSLMLDRNTDSSANPPFNLEKAISTIEMKVYQIASHRKSLNYISNLENVRPIATCSLVAITDTYLIIDNDGTIEVWEFEDRFDEVIDIQGEHPVIGFKEGYPTFTLYVRDTLADYLDYDMFIQIIGIHSINGASNSNSVIMENTLLKFDEQDDPAVKVWLTSLAQFELEQTIHITDYSNYTGKTTGQIITQLLSDYCQYITAGSISGGSITYTCPDDWEARGSKQLGTIIAELCENEDFLARLRPTGELDINDGTTATGVSIASTDQIDPLNNKPTQSYPISEKINYVRVFGGIDPVTGKKIGTDTPITAENEASQSLIGIRKWTKTFAGEFNTTYLQTKVNNILSTLAAAPRIINIAVRNTSAGFLQPGETISVGAGIYIHSSTKTLTAGTYIVFDCKYDAKNQIADLILQDGLYFEESASQTLSEQNSQLILQNAENIQIGTHPNASPAKGDHHAEGTTVTLTAGENLVFGEVCYFKSDGKMWKADADGGLVPVMALALETIAADADGEFLLYGFVRDDSWAWTVGGVIYLSDTAGALTQTAPGDDYVVGIATHADRLLFNPEYSAEGAGSYATTQHNRIITPSTIVPYNGTIAGNDNVYYAGSLIAFGITSKTVGGTYARINFRLPSDYVSGEDYTLYITWNCANTDNPNVIDYRVRHYIASDGEAYSNEDDNDSTWSGADNEFHNQETMTLTGTNAVAGDEVSIRLSMEDDNNAVLTYLTSIVLVIPVNTRD